MFDYLIQGGVIIFIVVFAYEFEETKKFFHNWLDERRKK